jgi:flagella basal body P-ring formation protein FlgA
MPSPPTATGRRTPVTNLDSILGMQARQSIQAGQVIFNDQVQQPVMVKRGDVVTVSAHSGGIRVRTTARARQDGVNGEIIQVETLERRERFDVRVVGPNQTAVFTAAAVRPAEASRAQRVETAQRPIPLVPPSYEGPIRNAPITK